MLKGVIFDLGSTLMRPTGQDAVTDARMQADLADHLIAQGLPLDREAFVAAFDAALDEFRAQRLRDWVEVTSAYVLGQALKALGLPPLSEAGLSRALTAYFAYSETLWEVMPEAYATLAALATRGYRLGLVSNTVDAAHMHRLIDNAGLRPWLDPVVLSAETGVRKPNPRIFEIVLEAWGLPPEQAVMVGDTLGSDVLGAQLAGMHSVWLASRTGAPANEAHRHTIEPEATIRSLGELPALLEAFPREAADSL
jgi:putative hydrolase of the HAD superfamily